MIQDLQAFGNSLIELFVGKCQEQIDVPMDKTEKVALQDFKKLVNNNKKGDASTESKKRRKAISVDGLMGQILGDHFAKVHSKQRTFSGGIALSDIPLNWSQKRETSCILEIINICYGPYGPNNTRDQIDTVSAFN